jgi:hypothetical protein
MNDPKPKRYVSGRIGRWQWLSGLVLLGAAWLVNASSAQARLDSCGGVYISADAECEFRETEQCTTSCSKQAVENSCAAQIYASCEGSCEAKASASCETSCDEACAVDCEEQAATDVPPDCTALCESDCQSAGKDGCADADRKGPCGACHAHTCSDRCEAKCQDQEVVAADVGTDAGADVRVRDLALRRPTQSAS